MAVARVWRGFQPFPLALFVPPKTGNSLSGGVGLSALPVPP